MFDCIETTTETIETTGTTAIITDSTSAADCAVNDFAATSLAAINDLLDEAVMQGAMSATRAWLVQHLVNAREAALESVS